MERIALAVAPGRRLAAGAPHARQPEAPHDLGLARIAHVDHRQDVVGEVGEVDRRIGIAPAGVPDAMRPETVGRHEADLGRLFRSGDVVDPDAGGEAAAVRQLVRRRAAEIGLLVLEFLHGPHARRVHGEQQVLVGLQMERARAGRTGDEVPHLRIFWVAHVDRGDAVAEPVAHIGEAAMHHDLDAVAAPAHVRVADELDVARCDGVHVTSPILSRRSPTQARHPKRAARCADRQGCFPRGPPSACVRAPARCRGRNG